MKLTITGKVETIIGVMRKLDICDAKFNINDGFCVDLDKVPECRKTAPTKEIKKTEEQPTTTRIVKRRGRPPKNSSTTSEPSQINVTNECELCHNKFKTKYPSAKFCDDCVSMYGVEGCRSRAKKLNETHESD